MSSWKGCQTKHFEIFCALYSSAAPSDSNESVDAGIEPGTVALVVRRSNHFVRSLGPFLHSHSVQSFFLSWKEPALYTIEQFLGHHFCIIFFIWRSFLFQATGYVLHLNTRNSLLGHCKHLKHVNDDICSMFYLLFFLCPLPFLSHCRLVISFSLSFRV
jgi:hypothetical protein